MKTELHVTFRKNQHRKQMLCLKLFRCIDSLFFCWEDFTQAGFNFNFPKPIMTLYQWENASIIYKRGDLSWRKISRNFSSSRKSEQQVTCAARGKWQANDQCNFPWGCPGTRCFYWAVRHPEEKTAKNWYDNSWRAHSDLFNDTVKAVKRSCATENVAKWLRYKSFPVRLTL